MADLRGMAACRAKFSLVPLASIAAGSILSQAITIEQRQRNAMRRRNSSLAIRDWHPQMKEGASLFVQHHHLSVSQTLLELRAAAPADPVQAYTGMVDYYAAAE